MGVLVLLSAHIQININHTLNVYLKRISNYINGILIIFNEIFYQLRENDLKSNSENIPPLSIQLNAIRHLLVTI